MGIRKVLLVDSRESRENMGFSLDLGKRYPTVEVETVNEAKEQIYAKKLFAVFVSCSQNQDEVVDFLQFVKEQQPKALRIFFAENEQEYFTGRAMQFFDQMIEKSSSVDSVIESLERAFVMRQRFVANEEKRAFSQLQISEELFAEAKQIVSQIDKETAQSSAKEDQELFARFQSCYQALQGKKQSDLDTIFAAFTDELALAVVLVLRLERGWALHACPHFAQSYLWTNSIDVAKDAARLSLLAGAEPKDVCLAFAAGILHDIGRLILAVSQPEKYAEVLSIAHQVEEDLFKAEKRKFFLGFDRIGALFLQLCGANNLLIEAVGAQRTPSLFASVDHIILPSLHAASTLYYGKKRESVSAESLLDKEYLEAEEIFGKIIQWSEDLGLLKHCEKSFLDSSGCRPKLLLVEDDERLRSGLKRLLRKEGIEVVQAEDGWQATEVLAKQKISLILADVKMPRMNGYQLLQSLKGDPDLTHIPVIMLSGVGDVESAVMCLEAGAEDYLQKPVDTVLLLTRVRGALEKSRLRETEEQQMKELQKEKLRVEELLRVLFPQPVIQELKKEKSVQPRSHEEVAVLFAAIVDFTKFCRTERPEIVFLHLQQVIDAMEQAADKAGMQKIKTIGDAFLCVGGLWGGRGNIVESAIQCGQEMIRVIPHLPAEWQIRVGIHLGPVISGVVGCRQYQFDAWGDTVNVAARIQSAALPGSVMISDHAYQRVAHVHPKTESSKIPLKGRGEMLLHLIKEPIVKEN